MPAATPEQSRWGERRYARFAPQRTDDLKPVAVPWIGRVIEVEFAGTMDEGDYTGQAMWMPVDRAVMPGVAWLPDCDLVDATAVEALAERPPTDAERAWGEASARTSIGVLTVEPGHTAVPERGVLVTMSVKVAHATDSPIAVFNNGDFAIAIAPHRLREGITYRLAASVADGKFTGHLIALDGEDVSDALIFTTPTPTTEGPAQP